MNRTYFVALLLAFLTIGTDVVWGEELLHEVIFNSTNNSGKIGSYTGSWYNTTNGFKVNITNANNNNNGWTYIKMGSKNSALTGTITTDAKITESITKVELVIDAISTANVNSITLSTSSDGSTYSNVGTFSKSQGTQVVTLSSPATNLYYRISVSCSKSSNGVITISGVKYYYENGITKTTVYLHHNSPYVLIVRLSSYQYLKDHIGTLPSPALFLRNNPLPMCILAHRQWYICTTPKEIANFPHKTTYHPHYKGLTKNGRLFDSHKCQRRRYTPNCLQR